MLMNKIKKHPFGMPTLKNRYKRVNNTIKTKQGQFINILSHRLLHVFINVLFLPNVLVLYFITHTKSNYSECLKTELVWISDSSVLSCFQTVRIRTVSEIRNKPFRFRTLFSVWNLNPKKSQWDKKFGFQTEESIWNPNIWGASWSSG